MIQPVKAQMMDPQGAKPSGKRKTENSDDFQSVLQSAAQKADSGDAKKTGSKKSKKHTQETNEPDQKRADAEQSMKTASASPNEAALFVSGEARLNQTPDLLTAMTQMQGKTQAEAESSSLEEVQTAGAAELQLQDSTVPGKELSQALTADGDSLPQDFKSRMPDEKNGKSAETSDALKAADSIKTAGKSVPKAQTKNNAAQPTDTSAFQQGKTRADAKSAQQTSAAASLSKGNAVQAAQPEQAQQVQKLPQDTKVQTSSDPKNAGSKRTETSLDSLSNLYGNGNVVIQVSASPSKSMPSPVHQVSNAVTYQLQNGKKECTVELQPQSLGKVSLKLTSQNGLLTVEIAAADPKTQNLLMSGSAEIRSLLQASTGQTVQTVIPNQQAAQWYGQPQDGGGNSGNQQRQRDESRKNRYRGIESVSSGMNTGDFLSMMQQISAFTR